MGIASREKLGDIKVSGALKLRLRRVMLDHELKTFENGIDFLLQRYEKGRKKFK